MPQKCGSLLADLVVENLITSELDANLSTKVPSKRLPPLQRQHLMTNSTTIYVPNTMAVFGEHGAKNLYEFLEAYWCY